MTPFHLQRDSKVNCRKFFFRPKVKHKNCSKLEESTKLGTKMHFSFKKESAQVNLESGHVCAAPGVAKKHWICKYQSARRDLITSGKEQSEKPW